MVVWKKNTSRINDHYHIASRPLYMYAYTHLIQEIFAIGSVSFHNSAHFIYAAVQSSRGNEPGELFIHELHADSKAVCHVGEGEGAVGLKQLGVSFDAHLSNEIASMRSKEAITFEILLHPDY